MEEKKKIVAVLLSFLIGFFVYAVMLNVSYAVIKEKDNNSYHAIPRYYYPEHKEIVYDSIFYYGGVFGKQPNNQVGVYFPKDDATGFQDGQILEFSYIYGWLTKSNYKIAFLISRIFALIIWGSIVIVGIKNKYKIIDWYNTNSKNERIKRLEQKLNDLNNKEESQNGRQK